MIVANRLPVRRTATRGGGDTWTTSPGGLVSALAPIVRERGGAWVGWTGAAGPAPKPFVASGITNLPVSVSRAEVGDFYHGQCNSTFWPLYHHAVREPEYHRHWWARYVEVNRRFAEVAARAAAPWARVWVHDYHLQLVPAMLREMRSDVTIGFFLHIPFPPPELFRRLPWRQEVLEGLLGSDVVGFQTRAARSNFLSLAARLIGTQRESGGVLHGGRRVRAGAFPISIDVERFANATASPAVAARAEQLRSSLGGGRKLLLGVDRLDYTKGIDLRLKAFREWLERPGSSIGDAVLVQVAVPSREQIPGYQELRSRVEELVGQINGEFGEIGTAAVHYLRRNMPFEDLVALYRAADVMVVTPLSDGMNLVAKEYVASRPDASGVLVLSEFAGAVGELRAALLVNPHDVDGLAETMDQALRLPEAEARRRMRSLRSAVESNTVYDWADRYLE
ncbi:MAG TPA: trehalose-6-phosphate synthase, partial [Thermoanaerobaculia bacterium]|nr:trehalose-6-phosphate synthase [Thermoanaerobaculia bacterium]